MREQSSRARTGRARAGASVVSASSIALTLCFAPALAHADLLVVAPHPDDDILTSAGVIYRARQAGTSVWVLYMTNGDARDTTLGLQRQGEAVAGQALLGVDEDHLLFLGYPDGSLDTLRQPAYAAEDSQYVPPRTQSAKTYGQRGLGRRDYHSHITGSAAAVNGFNLRADLAHVLRRYTPSDIFVTSARDVHPDHSATHELLRDALAIVRNGSADYDPTVHETIVWDSTQDIAAWPAASNPATYFTEPRNKPLAWHERESLDVPLPMQLRDFAENLKARAIHQHKTQGGFVAGAQRSASDNYISAFVHKDEFFWATRPAGGNRPPIPHAGFDQNARAGSRVTLDASASADSDGPAALRYEWRQVSGPRVALSDPGSAHPSFVAAGERGDVLSFELKVSDGISTSVADAVSVHVLDGAADPGPWDASAPSHDSGPPDAGAVVPTPAIGSDDPPGILDAGSPSPGSSWGHDAAMHSGDAAVGHPLPEPQDAGGSRADAGRNARGEAPILGASGLDPGAAALTPIFDASTTLAGWEPDSEVPAAGPLDVRGTETLQPPRAEHGDSTQAGDRTSAAASSDGGCALSARAARHPPWLLPVGLGVFVCSRRRRCARAR